MIPRPAGGVRTDLPDTGFVDLAADKGLLGQVTGHTGRPGVPSR